MKYTFEGFSQKKAIENKLDFKDLAILRFITDFYPNMTKKIIDNKEYVWISYKYILQEIPLLYLSKRSLFNRLTALENKGFLERKCIKNNEGTFSYIRLTEKMAILISEGMKKASDRMNLDSDEGQNLISDGGQKFTSDQNNPSIKINSSIKNIFLKEIYIKKEENEKNFEEFWKNYIPIKCNDRIVGKGSKKEAYKAYSKSLKKDTHKNIITGLEAYLKHCEENNQFTAAVTTFLNKEYWKNEYGNFINARQKTYQNSNNNNEREIL